MPPDGGGNASHAESIASLESGDTESNEAERNLEERAKHLAECTAVDEQDVELSLAFVNIHERVSDKTWV